ncbi:HD-GYP domain-containing protein [Bacillus sp. USDA818B3_A]|uniref:HD-GYP domain-containing protein n=1 Tax=Bacillus sp. USDA818B3_A TaxID=2698834 RepID=UPI00136C63F9|nr:HD domain-containing phosphohydrolase [Bacillus sp. USDA818B3_A]
MDINHKDFIETVHVRGVQISLLASGDGTEIIYHKLNPGVRWALGPAEGWTALEYLLVLSGELRYPSDNGYKVLKPGDSFFKRPVTDYYIFQSNQTTEFLYITSQPIFHHYSKASHDILDLALTIEEKDGYTVDHCARINRFSMLIGEELGFNAKQLLILNKASFLHDVGKVKVPLSILQKPGKLTSEEWEIMKKHTIYGRELLESTRLPVLIDAGVIVEQHHERYDGKGYPYGLMKNEISIEASIIAIVDSYDAMTTDRVYQKGKSKEEALEEIFRCRGTMYDPDIVDIFLSLQSKIS